MKNLKTIILLAISIGLVGLIVSCNWSKTQENKSQEIVTLTVLGENSSNLQAMESLKKLYEDKNPVKIDFKPNTFEDAFSKSNQDFANKTGLYDIVLQYNFSLSSFVRNKYVYTLSELAQQIPAEKKTFEQDIFPNVWKEVGYYYKNPTKPSNEIESVAYPFAANTMLLTYNKELFDNENYKAEYKKEFNEELEVPKDWQHFERVAKFFTKPDKQLYGVALQGATGGWLYYEWASFLQAFDGKIMDKEYGWQGDLTTKINVNSPQALATTKFLKGLKPYNAGNYTTVDAVEQRKLMKDGKVAMAIMWSDYVYELVEGGSDKRFGFAPTPGKYSMIAGGSFYINKQSKHPNESISYVISLLQKDNQIALMKKGLCSPIMSAYSDPEVQKIPYTNALKTSLDRAIYALEAGPDADLINQKITTYFQKYWNDELSAEAALEKAQTEIIGERKTIFSELK